MSTPRWPVIVFDLDGTVVNTIPLIIASYRHALGTVLGELPSESQARSWIGQTLYATFHERYPAHAQELIDTYIAWNLDHFDLIEDFPGIAELFAALAEAEVSVGVATSKRRSSAESTLRQVGLDLPVTVAMEDTSAHKPAPEPLLLAVERVGGTPERAVYVGDAVVDVLAAKAAGMASVAVTWGAGDRDALIAAAPDVLVDSPAELQATLL